MLRVKFLERSRALRLLQTEISIQGAPQARPTRQGTRHTWRTGTWELGKLADGVLILQSAVLLVREVGFVQRMGEAGSEVTTLPISRVTRGCLGGCSTKEEGAWRKLLGQRGPGSRMNASLQKA